MTRECLAAPMDEVKPPRKWTQRRDGVRARRAEATRQALITAARELFTQNGYHGVSVRDVTAHAGGTTPAWWIDVR